MSEKPITIRQIKSAIGRHDSHQACLRGLGIRRLHHPVTVPATPENLGMINKISYLLKIED
jgi:large subunit ribosomal protein L30